MEVCFLIGFITFIMGFIWSSMSILFLIEDSGQPKGFWTEIFIEEDLNMLKISSIITFIGVLFMYVGS